MRLAELSQWRDLPELLGVVPSSVRIERMVHLDQFREVAALRRQTYGRWYPHFVQPERPDSWDRAPSSVVLLARCLRTGGVLGTVRLRHSRDGREAGVFEPEGFPDSFFQEGPFMTVERLCIAAHPSRRRLVRLKLFATIIHLAASWGIRFLGIYTRRELEGLYRSIGFSVPEGEPRVLVGPLTNHTPQRFMRVEVHEAVARTRLPFARTMAAALIRNLDSEALFPENLGGKRSGMTAPCFASPRVSSRASSPTSTEPRETLQVRPSR